MNKQEQYDRRLTHALTRAAASVGCGYYSAVRSLLCSPCGLDIDCTWLRLISCHPGETSRQTVGSSCESPIISLQCASSVPECPGSLLWTHLLTPSGSYFSCSNHKKAQPADHTHLFLRSQAIDRPGRSEGQPDEILVGGVCIRCCPEQCL